LLEPENTILSVLLAQESIVKDDLSAAIVAVLKGYNNFQFLSIIVNENAL
jgi:hypothetical protein